MHLRRSQWLELPADVRQELASDLGLRKTRPSEIESTATGMRVVNDGYTDEELSKITPELLQAYLCCSPELDFETMWAMAVEKTKMFLPGGEFAEPVEIAPPEAPTESRLEPRVAPERLVKLVDPKEVPKIEPAPAGSSGLDIPVKLKKNEKAKK